MNPQNFTQRTAEALQGSQTLAKDLSHGSVKALHILRILLTQEDTLIPHLFALQKKDIKSFSQKIDSELSNLPKVSGDNVRNFDGEMQKIFDNADAYMKKMGDSYLSIEHLFLAFFDSSNSVKKFLENEFEKKQVEQIFQQIRGNKKVEDANPEAKRDALKKFCEDLTKRAEQGKIDPIIGRDMVIRRTM